MQASHSYSAYAVQLVVVLLLISAAVGIAVKWIRVPYSIALVIVGLLIGLFQVLPSVRMTPDLIMLVFLPPLLFEAAWNLDLDALKENWLPIFVFSVIGVVLSMTITGLSAQFFGGFSQVSAFTFGAMVAATDPISVIAIFRGLNIDKRLILLLEGESLFNDGTAVVLFNLVVTMALAGLAQGSAHVEFSLPVAAFKFSIIVAGGIFLGLVLGWLASRLHKYLDDHVLETMLTMVVAYGSFLIAERLEVSSVLSVVASGIVLGNSGRHIMSEDTVNAVDTFWEFAAFVVNSLVFLLIGLQIRLPLIAQHIKDIGIAVGAMLLARFVVVYALSPCITTKARPVPYKWRGILFWGALRGSLTMAMALSLPLNFPDRDSVIVVAFGAVLFTLLAQGLTMEPAIKLLKLQCAESASELADPDQGKTLESR